MGTRQSLATAAGAGALDECSLSKSDPAAVTRCLLDADKEAQAALFKAEGDAGKRARDVDTATGQPGAAAALAKSMRAFADYRKAQCDFVRLDVRHRRAAPTRRQLGCRDRRHAPPRARLHA